MFQPKALLVTGGAGFIGSHFIDYALRTDPKLQIVNVDKLTYAGSLQNLEIICDPERHHFVKADINDAELMKKLLREHQIDTLVHFAAESHVDRSIANPDAFMQANVLGTFNLLEAAKQVWLDEQGFTAKDCRFHHISTDEVYGSLGKDDAPFEEVFPYAPNSPYAASKAASDHVVRSYFHTFKLPVTLTNCSNNYGENQHAEKLIPTIIRACLEQSPIPIYGNGSNIRDWLYVEDHCAAIDAVIRKGQVGRTYNVGANNEWTNLDIAKHLAQWMDKINPTKAPHANLIEYVTDRAGHDWRYAINSSRIQTELGWEPKHSFESAIEKTILGILPKL